MVKGVGRVLFMLYGDYRDLVSTTTDEDLAVPRVQQPSTQRAKWYLLPLSSAGLYIDRGSDSRTIATNSGCLRCVSWW